MEFTSSGIENRITVDLSTEQCRLKKVESYT